MYYALAVITMLHPHLYQKLGMLIDYFTIPEYKFWTTFSPMDFLDLLLHAGLPIMFIIFGIRKQKRSKRNG